MMSRVPAFKLCLFKGPCNFSWDNRTFSFASWELTVADCRGNQGKYRVSSHTNYSIPIPNSPITQMPRERTPGFLFWEMVGGGKLGALVNQTCGQLMKVLGGAQGKICPSVSYVARARMLSLEFAPDMFRKQTAK